MKILRKLSLALFSLLLFCGMSTKAFASTPDIGIDAHTAGNNSDIVVRMKSRDGQKHAFRIYATYYDQRGRVIGRNADEDDSRTKRKEVEWSNIRNWEYVTVDMFCDYKHLESRTIRRIAFDENGVYLTCYTDKHDNIIAEMRFKDTGKIDYKVTLTCEDINGNEVYSDVDKGSSSAGPTIQWATVPTSWKYATLKYRVNGRTYTLGLTK